MVSLDVLIPHYNDITGLLLSLESIKVQTWKGKYRVVICDDGSDARVVEKLHSIVDDSGLSIKLILSPENKGRPFTRNILVDSIESEYVAWLDAGDEWYSEKIKVQFDAIYRAKYRYKDDLVWVSCNYDWQWIGRRKRIRKQNTNGCQVTSLLVGQDLRAYLWTLLGTAEAFKANGHFDENLPRLQDLDYFVRFSAKGGKIISPMTDKSLCVYHKSDIGRNGIEIRNCFLYIYNKHSYLYHKYTRRFRQNRRYEIEAHAARFAQNNGDKFIMYYQLVRAACTHPWLFFKSIYKNRGIKL